MSQGRTFDKKINLRLTMEEYEYLLSKGGNMSDYLRLLIKVDMRVNENPTGELKIKKPTKTSL